MRTTLTIDPDVAARVRQELRRTGRSLKAVINDALRRGLGMGPVRIPPPPFRVRPHHFGVRPGTDLDRMNQLADQLETVERAARLGRGSS